MANVISNLGSWSTTPSSNEPNAGSDTSSVREDLQTIQAVVRKYLATATTLAAGATTDLSTAAGNLVTLTGTATTINSFGTVSAGLTYYIISNAAHTVTYNATSMKLPGGASITLASGDVLEMTSEGSGNWKCVGFQPFAGYQPKDADLTAIAALSTQAYGRSLLETASESALKALINLEIGTDVQAYDATLTAFAGGLTAANKIPYATALNTLGELDFKDEDDMASNSATAIPSQQSVKAYVDAQVSGLDSGTVQNTTSVSSVEWTSIPAGTKRITVSFAGVSNNISTTTKIQIGDSGGYETTAYESSGVTSSASGFTNTTLSTGFLIGGASWSGGDKMYGQITLTLQNSSSNTWVAGGVLNSTDPSSPQQHSCGGSKSLSGTLDRVKLMVDVGSFDAGSVNILYE